MELKPFSVFFNVLFRHKEEITDELWLTYYKEKMNLEEAKRLVKILFALGRKVKEEGYQQWSTNTKEFEIYRVTVDGQEISLSIDTTLKSNEGIIDFSKEKEEYVLKHLQNHYEGERGLHKKDKYLLQKKEKEIKKKINDLKSI